MVVSSETLRGVASNEHCPFCGSENIEGDFFEGGGEQVWQRVSCLDCENRWTDVYQHVEQEVDEDDWAAWTSDKESENE
jgi:formate dehydrogenase maturation protein FdhE